MMNIINEFCKEKHSSYLHIIGTTSIKFNIRVTTSLLLLLCSFAVISVLWILQHKHEEAKQTADFVQPRLVRLKWDRNLISS